MTSGIKFKKIQMAHPLPRPTCCAARPQPLYLSCCCQSVASRQTTDASHSDPINIIIAATARLYTSRIGCNSTHQAPQASPQARQARSTTPSHATTSYTSPHSSCRACVLLVNNNSRAECEFARAGLRN